MSTSGTGKSIARTAATGGDLDPDFLRWSTSLPVDRRLLEVDCRGSVAHVRGLEAAGLVSPEEARTLVDALESLPGKVARGEVSLREDEEDVHMAVEAWLSEEVGAVAAKLHTGRSRNDQVATDLKLWCRDAVEQVEAGIDEVLAAAKAWIAHHGEVPMPSYTHRQVAIPALGRVWLEGAIVAGLRRDRTLLAAVRQELSSSPLGAGAIGGTTLPIDTSITAAALGFGRGPDNPIDAVGERDHALTLLFVCARIGLHVARLSTDVIELSSDGLVRLGGAIAGGSSMMPHKRNPDMFELLRGQAALRQGELVALLSTFHGLGSGYFRDLQQDKEIVFRAVDGTLDVLRMTALGLRHFEPVEDACLSALIKGDAIATDLCEALVAAGQPFREAYGVVGRLVVQQREAGRRLADLGSEELVALGLDDAAIAELELRRSARRRAARFA
ncbi:MAG: argininosuccinate lyase [Myxococcales bacterium]|nr:argininosuccinate lyase [Myxococcales bacterium]MCB9717099.1 argininosuccinate lyase [Myxococcales bacterium]